MRSYKKLVTRIRIGKSDFGEVGEGIRIGKSGFREVQRMNHKECQEKPKHHGHCRMFGHNQRFIPFK
jgi:hypothetical protein